MAGTTVVEGSKMVLICLFVSHRDAHGALKLSGILPELRGRNSRTMAIKVLNYNATIMCKEKNEGSNM